MARAHRTVLLVVVLLFAPQGRALAADDPLAIVAAARGDVQITSGTKSPQDATFGRPLQRGDKVHVEKDASATIVFNDGNVIELSGGSSITIGGRMSEKPKVGPGAALPDEVFKQVSKYVTGGSRQTGLVAISAMRSDTDDRTPLILAPRETDVLTDRPSFRWRPLEGATHYEVTVMGDQGRAWTRKSEAAELSYPSDVAPLEAGADYVWAIEAWRDREKLRADETSFHVLDKERREVIQKDVARIGESTGGADTPASHFLSGSYLFSRGVYVDAAGQFEALSRLSPDSPAPHEALGNVYRAVGLMDLAVAEFERALALAQER